MLAKHREPAKNEIEVAAIASLRNISVARRANGAGSGLGRLRYPSDEPVIIGRSRAPPGCPMLPRAARDYSLRGSREDVIMAHLTEDWNGLHLLVVHIPIILLLVAPLLVIVGVRFSAAKRQLLLGSALILMVLGTAMTYVAVATGKSATKVVASAPALIGLLE